MAPKTDSGTGGVILPEIQKSLGCQHIYCEVCENEYVGLSVIATHNLRRHEYSSEVYGHEEYFNRVCRECGTEGYFEPTESDGGAGETKLLTCSACGTFQ